MRGPDWRAGRSSMRGNGRKPYLIGTVAAMVAAFGGLALFAATKAVDLDGKTANGAESSCSLTVLTTFPAKVESKITNKAVGDSFSFVWPSAALGGFSGTLAPGTAT